MMIIAKLMIKPPKVVDDDDDDNVSVARRKKYMVSILSRNLNEKLNKKIFNLNEARSCFFACSFESHLKVIQNCQVQQCKLK